MFTLHTTLKYPISHTLLDAVAPLPGQDRDAMFRALQIIKNAHIEGRISTEHKGALKDLIHGRNSLPEYLLSRFTATERRDLIQTATF